MEEPKNPVGRPSLYKPEYCQKLIDHMSQGYSFESFAAVVDVNRDTLYQWKKDHADFSDAVTKAFSKCLLKWEEIGMEGLWGNKNAIFSQNVYTFNMKNRFKWTDKVEVEAGEETKNMIKLAYKLEGDK